MNPSRPLTRSPSPAPFEPVDGTLDLLARGSALGALLLLAVALLALGFSSHQPPDEALPGALPPFDSDIEVNAPAHTAPILEVP